MKHVFTFLFLLVVSIGYSQQTLLEDFEGSPVIKGFENLGSATIEADPQSGGTHGSAFKLVTSASGNAYQGGEVDLASGNYADLRTDKTMKIDVYSTTAFSLMAKVEDKVSTSNIAPTAANTQAHNGTGWETMTFTFTTGSDGTLTANGTYTRVALFPNRKADDSGWNSPIAAVTMYADNITAVKYVATGPTCSDGIMNGDETGIDCGGTSCGPCPVPPTTAPPTPPNRNAADVLSIYGDAYGTAVGISNVTWDDPAIFAEESIAGNTVIKANLGNSTFIATDLNTTPTDATSMTHFHIDYWVADRFTTGQTLNVKWSNHAGGGDETSAFWKTDELVAADVQTWKSMDVEISTLPNNTTRNELWEFIVTAANSDGSASLIYFDNVYFYKGTPLSINEFDGQNKISIYPNPAENEVTISAAQVVEHVSIYDLTGRQVLSATPNAAAFSLNVSNLNKGVYLVSIKADGQEMTAKLVK